MFRIIMLTFHTWSGQGPITRREKGLFGVKWPYGEDKVLPSAIQPHMKYWHSKH